MQCRKVIYCAALPSVTKLKFLHAWQSDQGYALYNSGVELFVAQLEVTGIYLILERYEMYARLLSVATYCWGKSVTFVCMCKLTFYQYNLLLY